MSLIELRNVSKTFDRVTALDRVSLTIEKGEVVGLLGPNGSGKTTLLRLLSAYFPPTYGHVLVDGYDTREASLTVRQRIGYALEGVILYPDLTLNDFFDFVSTVKNVSREQRSDVVVQCGLADWLQRRIGTLSKGYRQRVMLAQALMGKPSILILDEPTSSMDPEMAVSVRNMITALAGARTVLLSTHSLAEAALVCQRVIVLHHGRVLTQGTPQEVFSLPSSTTTFEDEFIRILQRDENRSVTSVNGP